ncbi:30S ribosomal protein S6 [Shimazuella sp. AN120528]|uniref:30S ribosomal protein S6 n=1 Tax=Shimazuella soli TaxID=1892854 RepID=UPI001F0D97E4|nr:30S ribosomal protein S6 [Shimazuella soli]MCH5585055.1 30S ribosomal protein S6 [Shimazuella soli]
MSKYELMFIVRPDVDEAALTSTRERVQSIVSDMGGQVEEVKDMGKRRLAYLIDNYREGFYTVTTFQSNADAVQEVERVLNINDNVMRFLTINLDQK